jgi:hypothetical protein
VNNGTTIPGRLRIRRVPRTSGQGYHSCYLARRCIHRARNTKAAATLTSLIMSNHVELGASIRLRPTHGIRTHGSGTTQYFRQIQLLTRGRDLIFAPLAGDRGGVEPPGAPVLRALCEGAWPRGWPSVHQFKVWPTQPCLWNCRSDPLYGRCPCLSVVSAVSGHCRRGHIADRARYSHDPSGSLSRSAAIPMGGVKRSVKPSA